MDIIYSRRKIKIKKPGKKEKLKLIIMALVFLIFISIYLYMKAAYPIFIASCRTKANSMANNMVNKEVQEVIKGYTYSDLFTIQRDDDGKITIIQSETNKINNIISQIVKNIQETIDSSDTGIIYVNLGTISGISFLSFVGPKFEIELERARKNRNRY